MEFNGTFLATIVTFVLFVFLMNKILYNPILNIMEQRKNFIDGNYESAKNNDAKTESLTNEREEKLLTAKNDARAQYLEKLGEFKSQKSDILSEAQNSANAKLEASKLELEHLSNEVKQGLKGSMTSLANDIVEKVVGYRSEVQGFDDEMVNKVLWEK